MCPGRGMQSCSEGAGSHCLCGLDAGPAHEVTTSTNRISPVSDWRYLVMAPTKVLVALKRHLWYQCPGIWRSRDQPIRRKPSSNSPSIQEIIMEIALIPGLFVGIFALGAAMILWFPYDR
jgi:hypothetical protein